MANVFETQTANGNHELSWTGGDGYLICKGMFDGATVVVVGITDDDGVEIPLEKEATFRETRGVQFSFPAGKIKGKITGVGSSSSLTLQAVYK